MDLSRSERRHYFDPETITVMKNCLSIASLVLTMATVSAHAERHIYVADHDVRLVLKIKEDGTVLWKARNNNGHDVQVLENGNVLVNCPPSVREYAPDGKIVWEAGKEVAADPESAQRLHNGHTLIADNAKHRVVEIDADKKIVWTFDVPNSNHRPTPTMRQVRRLDNGNTLICASTLDKVIEVSPAKQVVWEYSIPFPYLATRLANGHTMISSGSGYGSPRGVFRGRGRSRRQDRLEIRWRRCSGGPEAQLAERLCAIAGRSHAHFRGAGRNDPGGLAGQKAGPHDQEPGDATSVHVGRR